MGSVNIRASSKKATGPRSLDFGYSRNAAHHLQQEGTEAEEAAEEE